MFVDLLGRIVLFGGFERGSVVGKLVTAAGAGRRSNEHALGTDAVIGCVWLAFEAGSTFISPVDWMPDAKQILPVCRPPLDVIARCCVQLFNRGEAVGPAGPNPKSGAAVASDCFHVTAGELVVGNTDGVGDPTNQGTILKWNLDRKFLECIRESLAVPNISHSLMLTGLRDGADGGLFSLVSELILDQLGLGFCRGNSGVCGGCGVSVGCLKINFAHLSE